MSINASANQWDKNRLTFGKVFAHISAHTNTDVANAEKLKMSGVRPRSKAFSEEETSDQPCHQILGEEQAQITMMSMMLMLMLILMMTTVISDDSYFSTPKKRRQR